MKLPIGLALGALALLSLAGCSSLRTVENAFSTATGTSISSGRAITFNDGLRTVQDAATSYINGCVASKSTTGLCAYGDEAYSDLLVLRSDRAALLAYA